MKSPILGSAYVARSVNAADNRMVNLFPEIVPEAGKAPAFLNRAPGLNPLNSFGTGPIRGMRVVNDVLYLVSGNKLYSTAPPFTFTELGTVAGTTEPVSMSDNGTQLFVACNGPSYIFNTVTNVFAQITDPDFTGAKTVTYLDGYFVYNEPNSELIWVTALLDGTSVDPLDFSSADGLPDKIVGLVASNRELWVFGTNSVEVWYNAGNLDFPLQRMQGGFNEIGCAAAFSIAKLDNSVFWLGRDARGQGIIYRTNGYAGQRISTHAVEWQIQQYGDLSGAVAYTYQQDGHSFYVINFPNGDTTFVYDVSTGAWHERAGFTNGEFTRHRGNCQAALGNLVIVGDYQNGLIYKLDLDYYSDATLVGSTIYTSPQKWLRSWRALPTGQNDLKRTAQHSLQLDCESGVGINSGQGSDPQVMLRWSDDGGHTWSSEHWSPMGKIGAYYQRVFWRRLGMTLKLRDRVYEISGTDPVKIAITGAELILSGTNA